MQLPLEDIKMLDLTHALAGPFCSTMLADFGAQVIKLEPPGEGDIARAWGVRTGGGESSYFVSLHRNKRGIVVDLKHPQGRELFFKLVEKCDVVLENYRVGALKRLGLELMVRARFPPGLGACGDDAWRSPRVAPGGGAPGGGGGRDGEFIADAAWFWRNW